MKPGRQTDRQHAQVRTYIPYIHAYIPAYLHIERERGQASERAREGGRERDGERERDAQTNSRSLAHGRPLKAIIIHQQGASSNHHVNEEARDHRASLSKLPRLDRLGVSDIVVSKPCGAGGFRVGDLEFEDLSKEARGEGVLTGSCGVCV